MMRKLKLFLSVGANLLYMVIIFSTSLVGSDKPRFEWGRQLGTVAEDFGKSVGIDGSGNIYITGWTADTLAGTHFGGKDVFLFKFDKNGKIIWSRQFGTEADERAQELTVDFIGNCYITGSTEGDLKGVNFGEADIFLAKYDSCGNHLWTNQIGTDKEDVGQYVTIDSSGNIFITGSTRGNLRGVNAGEQDIFLIKYDVKGDLIFKHQFGTGENDIGRGIAFGGEGNIYVCGMTGGDWGDSNTKKMDAFIAKYTPNGELIHNRKFGTRYFDVGANIKVDGNGNIYLGGSTGGDLDGHQAGRGDAYLAKFDKIGRQIWIRQFGRDKWDGVLSLILMKNGSGNVLISGCQNWPTCEGYCRMYDPNGNLLWIREFVAQGVKDGTCGKDVAVDALGNYYHVGGTGGDLFKNNSGKHDAYLIKLSTQNISSKIGK